MSLRDWRERESGSSLRWLRKWEQLPRLSRSTESPPTLLFWWEHDEVLQLLGLEKHPIDGSISTIVPVMYDHVVIRPRLSCLMHLIGMLVACLRFPRRVHSLQAFRLPQCPSGYVFTDSRARGFSASWSKMASSEDSLRPVDEWVDNKIELRVLPTVLELNQVSLKLPRTLQRLMFSSDPYREHALRNMSLVINPSEFVLITGPSSSGKSALLKILTGSWTPTTGSVNISTAKSDSDSDSTVVRESLAAAPARSAAKPVYLDDPTRFTYRDSAQTLESILQEILRASWRVQDCGRTSTLLKVNEGLVNELCKCLGLREALESASRLRPRDLSQSESYCFGLLIASLESMLPAAEVTYSDDLTCQATRACTCSLPAPILLLDEVREKGLIQTWWFLRDIS